jgi:LDH2 family malate/lactate/ureidoglycolate dehydrogenase
VQVPGPKPGLVCRPARRTLVAWPTDGDPVMLDVSQSITTNLMTRRLRAEGRRFPGQWAVDNGGLPTDDPGAMFTDPPGALLPTGGADPLA